MGVFTNGLETEDVKQEINPAVHENNYETGLHFFLLTNKRAPETPFKHLSATHRNRPSLL